MNSRQREARITSAEQATGQGRIRIAALFRTPRGFSKLSREEQQRLHDEFLAERGIRPQDGDTIYIISWKEPSDEPEVRPPPPPCASE